MRLKIFADKSYLFGQDRYVILLYPFWGLIPEPQGDKDTGRFDDYYNLGQKFFLMASSLSEADVAILPFEWRSKSNIHAKLAYKLAKEVDNFGKRLIIFFNNDSDENIPIKNSIIFRTSFYRSKRKSNEFAIPGWSVDFLPRYLDNKLQIREKRSSPIVGYCGYVDYYYRNLKSILKHAIGLTSGRKPTLGARLRGYAVRTLLRDKRIQMNFVFRKGFSGCCDNSIRYEYVKNMVESDYALVTRGAGNFSYRLYEVLSCGRIPVFVDTDCVLPFDHLIDWKKYCVWVDVKDIESIGDKVAEFHDSISDNDFADLQYSIRQLYEEWMSPVGFHRNLWSCLTENKMKCGENVKII